MHSFSGASAKAHDFSTDSQQTQSGSLDVGASRCAGDSQLHGGSSMAGGATFDFCELFDAIVDSSANAYEKLIALIIARHVGRGGEAAYPSRARILRKASCSMATFKRSQAALAAFFDTETCKGKSTLYVPKPAVTTDEIEAAIALSRQKSRDLTDTGCSQDPVSHRADSRYLTEPEVGVPESPEKKPLKKRKKKESSLRSDSPPATPDGELPLGDMTPDRIVWGRCAEWMIKKTGKSDKQVKSLIGRWLKIVTHHELLQAFRSCFKAEADPITYIGAIVLRAEKVALERCRRENGRLVVVNGFRQELETLLNGRNIDRSLDRINGNIPQHMVGLDLEARVRSEVIKLVDIEESWQARHQSRPNGGRKTQEEIDDAYLDRLARKYLEETA
jgi:hypothetical protein